jgi:NADPH:quinone reductase-like Zn-dependent oxidoreductase
VRYHKHGHPSAVLQVESVTLDTASVGARDVLVRMVCAPLTALDVAAITGFGGRAPAFPRVGGNEGLGVVEQAGASSGLAKGDVVVATAPGVGELLSGPAPACVEASAPCSARSLARAPARPSARPPARPPSFSPAASSGCLRARCRSCCAS